MRLVAREISATAIAARTGVTMKLGELARQLGCLLEGDATVDIQGVAGIEHAKPGQLTFVSNPRYTQVLGTTRASAVLLGKDIHVHRGPDLPPLSILRSAN